MSSSPGHFSHHNHNDRGQCNNDYGWDSATNSYYTTSATSLETTSDDTTSTTSDVSASHGREFTRAPTLTPRPPLSSRHNLVAPSSKHFFSVPKGVLCKVSRQVLPVVPYYDDHGPTIISSTLITTKSTSNSPLSSCKDNREKQYVLRTSPLGANTSCWPPPLASRKSAKTKNEAKTSYQPPIKKASKWEAHVHKGLVTKLNKPKPRFRDSDITASAGKLPAKTKRTSYYGRGPMFSKLQTLKALSAAHHERMEYVRMELRKTNANILRSKLTTSFSSPPGPTTSTSTSSSDPNNPSRAKDWVQSSRSTTGSVKCMSTTDMNLASECASTLATLKYTMG